MSCLPGQPTPHLSVQQRGWFHHGSSCPGRRRGRPARRHHSCRGDDRGREVVGDAEFPTTADGYRGAIAFLTAAVAWSGSGWRVPPATAPGSPGRWRGRDRGGRGRPADPIGPAPGREVRPARRLPRRPGGAGRADQPGQGPGIDGLRALHLARRSAVKARTAAINQMKAILIMAPEPVRARFRG